MSEWEPLKISNEYEINKNFPYYVRRVGSQKNELLTMMDAGYLGINIHCHLYGFHRVVATQWIPNPNHYSIVDHINGNVQDWHVENLRWASRKENCRNRHICKGVELTLLEDIPDTCRPLDIFKNTRIYDIYIDMITKEVYKYNSILFQQLQQLTTGKGNYIRFNSRRFYINDIINSIHELKPEVISIQTKQNCIIEYLTSLPEYTKPIKTFHGQKLKRFYWFDTSNDRIILLNKREDQYKYRYIRSHTIVVQYSNGNKEFNVPTYELIKSMNPNYISIYEDSEEMKIADAVDFVE